MNVDREVFTNSADIIFETTNGTANHIWVNTARQSIYTGMGAGDSKIIYKYYLNRDDFISWIVLFTQQLDEGDTPYYRCIKGNRIIQEQILTEDADDIYDRVLSLDEATAARMIVPT
jgi:hypothetical protein